LLPLIIGVAAIILGLLPWPWTQTILMTPDFLLIVVFYWLLLRPDLLPPLSLFALGLLQGILSNSILGLDAFLLLLAVPIFALMRNFMVAKPFLYVWMVFAAFVLSYFILYYLLGGLLLGAWVEMRWIMLRYFSTLLLMPLVFSITSLLHRLTTRFTPNLT
jgi:rod shape-determining protein MreD